MSKRRDIDITASADTNEFDDDFPEFDFEEGITFSRGVKPDRAHARREVERRLERLRFRAELDDELYVPRRRRRRRQGRTPVHLDS